MQPKNIFAFPSDMSWMVLVFFVLLCMLGGALVLNYQVGELRRQRRRKKAEDRLARMRELTGGLSGEQIRRVLRSRANEGEQTGGLPGSGGKGGTSEQKGGLPGSGEKGGRGMIGMAFIASLIAVLAPVERTFGQPASPSAGTLLSHTGVLVTVVLLAIPVLFGILMLALRARRTAREQRHSEDVEDAGRFADYLASLSPEEAGKALKERKKALDFELTQTELSGGKNAADDRGILQIESRLTVPVVGRKRKAPPRPGV
ncbi:MAG TPA: hypothetical protein VG605_24125, partial [Puia sp.]|nr:hypothetical protein [Puia sp.]